MEAGITVKKSENFSEWYVQVLLKAGLVDYAPVHGFMFLRPYGYAIWEIVASELDRLIKQTGHLNAFVPTLIPEQLLRREEEHFEGFEPEVFWVAEAGKEKLKERLAIRPTSETLIYHFYAKWVRSYRDLPILLNFWNSAMRAEIKATKPFIRTAEFLWQEGHTVHASYEEADAEVKKMLEVYRQVAEQWLAIPVIVGKKSESEKFAGALYTATLETLVPDGKAVQIATSHHLGQNFSRAFGIQFLDAKGEKQYAWQACWGFSWRPIGAMVMLHGDDKGLVLPPRIAPQQVVIVPIYYDVEQRERVLSKARKLEQELRAAGLRVLLDDRLEYTPGWKFNEWELKGVPLRLEVGPKDLEAQQVMGVRRDNFQRVTIKGFELVETVKQLLDSIQLSLFERAKQFLEAHTHEAKGYEELKARVRQGMVKAGWCGSEECEQKIKAETGATIRAIPFDSQASQISCIVCQERAECVAYFARAY